MPIGLPHLPREAVHVGIKPRVEQHRGIDLFRFGVSGGTVEKVGKAAKKLREDLNRRLVH